MSSSIDGHFAIMPELRWTLLILGLLFLAALALWELRRKRRLPSNESTQRSGEIAQAFREPTLVLPEIRVRDGAPVAQELPVVEIDESMLGLRAQGVRIEEDISAVDVPAAATQPEAQAPSEPEARTEAGESSASNIEPQSETAAQPIVDWPPEDQRKLVALRLAALPGERFAGRALRLALVAEGFVLGKFSIFHKPGPDARVTVSAASLTQPGSFDLETMDTQRYSGIGLFIVLPGPLPALAMLDELLTAGRDLKDRLQGSLQDERGQALSAERIAQLRAGLDAEAVPAVATAQSALDSAATPEPPQ